MAGRVVVAGIVRIPHVVSNAYLLDTGDGVVLVDTGMPGRAPEIEREIAMLRRSLRTDLRAIAITHAHVDHAGNLVAIAAAHEVPIAIGAADAPVILAGGTPPTPKPTGPLGRVMAAVSPRFELAAARVDALLSDGDAVPGVPRLRAIHTPGHTPGHTAYIWPEHGGVLFAGDVAVHVLGLRESFVHADREEARATLGRLGQLDFETAVFGHGPPIRGGAVVRIRRLAERLAR